MKSAFCHLSNCFSWFCLAVFESSWAGVCKMLRYDRCEVLLREEWAFAATLSASVFRHLQQAVRCGISLVYFRDFMGLHSFMQLTRVATAGVPVKGRGGVAPRCVAFP